MKEVEDKDEGLSHGELERCMIPFYINSIYWPEQDDDRAIPSTMYT